MATQAERVFADVRRWEAARTQTINLRNSLGDKFTAEIVREHKWLTLVAEHYAANYRGDFDYMLSMRDTARALSYPQCAGVLNCAIADWRRMDRFVDHPPEQFSLPNVADVPNSRYRVVSADGTSLSVRLDNATWANDKPEGTRALYYLGQGADWQFAAFVRASGQVDLIKREQRMAPRLKQVLGDLAGSVREGRWLVHALAFSLEGGVCCFCGRELDTAESISVGYGPVCAAKHGLPWGEVAEPASVVLARDAMRDGGIMPDDPNAEPETPEEREQRYAAPPACPGCASHGAIVAHYDSCPDREPTLDDPAVVRGFAIANEQVEPAFKGHAYGVFESGRLILDKAGKIDVDASFGKSSYRPGRSYEEIFGDD